ncbi:hypothetical protein FRC01_000697 [Tulasnella sp. 417]|nr:hypothetical protein FRC01_000697 [Tulasnella sp. 417]
MHGIRSNNRAIILRLARDPSANFPPGPVAGASYRPPQRHFRNAGYHGELFSGSVPNLVKANRMLQSVYEQMLYRHINLYRQPRRTRRLLETFRLRPDLALLVQGLDIDLKPCENDLNSEHRIISAFHMAGLALARNVKSLGISGICWLWGGEMSAIYEIVAKLKLTSLRILKWRPDDRSIPLPPFEVVLANLRAILQGQPMLQDLRVESYVFDDCPEASLAQLAGGSSMGVISPGIEQSDVPSLRILRGNVTTIASILPVMVGDCLDSLEMYKWDYYKYSLDRLLASFSDLQEARQRIRRLHLSVESECLSAGWKFNLRKVLELFPSVKSLKIIGSSGASLVRYPAILDDYIEKNASLDKSGRNLSSLIENTDFLGSSLRGYLNYQSRRGKGHSTKGTA